MFCATEADVSNLKIKGLISYTWNNIEIGAITKQQSSPLNYFHVKDIDLYNETKSILRENTVTFFNSTLTEKPVKKLIFFVITLENETINVNKVFDTRPPAFKATQKNQSHISNLFMLGRLKLLQTHLTRQQW